MLHPQLHDLRAALGKGVPAEKAGVFEKPLNFRGGLVFGVDNQGQTEDIPHIINLLGVFRVADPGDGMKLRIHGVGRGAAQQIDFVLAGGGDEKIRVLDLGLGQHGHGGAVALHAEHIVALHAFRQHLAVGIDQGNVVALRGELAGQGGPYLAVACDNDVHTDPHSAAPSPGRKIYCIITLFYRKSNRRNNIRGAVRLKI